ncbi:hypothetical protein ACET3Z_000031 [Daucus carota]
MHSSSQHQHKAVTVAYAVYLHKISVHLQPAVDKYVGYVVYRVRVKHGGRKRPVQGKQSVAEECAGRKLASLKVASIDIFDQFHLHLEWLIFIKDCILYGDLSRIWCYDNIALKISGLSSDKLTSTAVLRRLLPQTKFRVFRPANSRVAIEYGIAEIMFQAFSYAFPYDAFTWPKKDMEIYWVIFSMLLN